MTQVQDAAFQRARRPEQRKQREQAILDAAEALLAEMPAADVSLRELSRRVGLSKSNVVRYFETREAVFLELLQRSAGEWLDALDSELPPAVPGIPPGVRSVTDAWARSLARRPLLCELWSMLSAVLERNASAGSIRRFKLAEIENRQRLADLLQGRIPGLAPAPALELVSVSIVLTSGLWPFANPSPAVIEATSDPRLSDSCIDFADTLSRMLQVTITGLLAHPAPGKLQHAASSSAAAP
jgi:AcrR family transcriptional regulator